MSPFSAIMYAVAMNKSKLSVGIGNKHSTLRVCGNVDREDADIHNSEIGCPINLQSIV
jgi:hypothetical protein